ncbi:MAG TPA: gamma-glutamyltransferase [Microlunatus sp.]
MSAARGRRRQIRVFGVSAACVALLLLPAVSTSASPAGVSPAGAQAPTAAAGGPRHTEKNPTAYGSGGAVASVDPEATEAGLKVLRQGGNAVDAAVATAAALGVTEPYSAGIGGGGYFVYYNAKTRKVSTLDGRETAPASISNDAFIEPATGKPYQFFPNLVTSGVSVGVPGTPATWEAALDRWGSLSLKQALRPAIKIARRGFVVDATFASQTEDNAERFANIDTTAELFLPGGKVPAVGSIFRNPDLADTYATLGREGTDVIYRGPIGAEIVRTVRKPPKAENATLPVPKGTMTMADLAAYRVLRQAPTTSTYRGLDVYGMAPSSSGGTTIGEALNILETTNLSRLPKEQALHYYLDASALAFADRAAYVGDPAYVNVPTETLLSKGFARSRACQIDPQRALKTPAMPGELSATGCETAKAEGTNDPGTSTTHLVTSDRWGNVVSYTLTIEQTGGSGIVVRDRGFLLNNELTDFSTTYVRTDPNRIQGGKRPRSSMSPTIVLKDGKPFLAVGSPGGSTIITTVLQTLVNRIDFKMTLPEAVAEPRASLRNTEKVTVEPEFYDLYNAGLERRGYVLTKSGDALTSAAQIGAVAALEFFPNGRVQAVAEPVRRGGGDAGVVEPRRR